MRRLPVFFVLDCSESMVGEKIQRMEEGIAAVVKTLRTDPHALETVHVAVIAFAGVAKTIAPMVEVVSFYPPKLPLGGGTSLGAALEVLMDSIEKNVVKTTPEKKGDWKPIVYLFTDGHPTDNSAQSVSRWTSAYANKATLIAVGLGKSVDLSILHKLTENVLVLEDSSEADFKKFINWVTASVVAQSKSVGEGKDAAGLPDLDESVLKVVKETRVSDVDETCVTLVGRCRKSRRPYIVKYERETKAVSTRDFKFDVASYDIAGCYPLDEDYFSWSDPKATGQKVNTNELVGAPGCPHCGAISAFAVCGCGKLMCIDGPEEVTCPWCEKKVSFAPVNSSGESGLDVARGRG